jgi:hypothetical protein
MHGQQNVKPSYPIFAKITIYTCFSQATPFLQVFPQTPLFICLLLCTYHMQHPTHPLAVDHRMVFLEVYKVLHFEIFSKFLLLSSSYAYASYAVLYFRKPSAGISFLLLESMFDAFIKLRGNYSFVYLKIYVFRWQRRR